MNSIGTKPAARLWARQQAASGVSRAYHAVLEAPVILEARPALPRRGSASDKFTDRRKMNERSQFVLCFQHPIQKRTQFPESSRNSARVGTNRAGKQQNGPNEANYSFCFQQRSVNNEHNNPAWAAASGGHSGTAGLCRQGCAFPGIVQRQRQLCRGTVSR